MQTQELVNAQAALMRRRPHRNGSQPQPLAAILPQATQAPPETDEFAPERTVPMARLDELDTNWHPLVGTAVSAARAWQQHRRQQAANGEPPNASLILVATAVPGDIQRTGYGCGKTHVARACLWSIAYMVDGHPLAPAGKFFLAESLINRLDGEVPIQAILNDAPIVVVDDVGAEGVIPFVKQDDKSQTEERQARYFKLVDHCLNRGVSLILTGNLSIHDLARHVGGRAWSRLLQMAPAGSMVDMTGVPDYRRQVGGR